MEIDLFTFIAQIINLIILLFLLRRFLYIPVLRAVEARQKLIADELASAAEARRLAQKEEAKCVAKMQEIEAQKQEILSQVQADAQKLSVKLTEEANEQYKQSQKRLQDKLVAEHKNFDVTVQNLVVECFNKFATSALQQMAGVDLDDLIIRQFENKLSELSVTDKKSFAEAYQNKKAILVKSADQLSGAKREELEKLLVKTLKLKDNVKFQYVVEHELVGGLCIQADEQVIEWSLRSYLQDFRNNLNSEVSQMLSRG